MAKAAKDTDVEIVHEPDFETAASIIRSKVKPAEEKNAKSRGDLSAAWKTIEDDCHVNKKAAKDVHKLVGMSDESRDDYLRSFYGLMKQFNLGINEDLVDKAEGNGAPKMPTRKVAGMGTEALATLN